MALMMGEREVKEESAAAENQRVFKGAPKVRIGEHCFKVVKAYPWTEQDSFVEPEVFKGKRHAADR